MLNRWALNRCLSKRKEPNCTGESFAADPPRAARTRRTMVAGTFRPPWEDKVKITDGTSCGFPAPTRGIGGTAKAAE